LLLVAFLLVAAPNCHLSLVLASVVQGDAVNCNNIYIFFNCTRLFLYVLIMKLPNFSKYMTIFHVYKFILKVANNFVLLLKAKFKILQCSSPNRFIL